MNKLSGLIDYPYLPDMRFNRRQGFARLSCALFGHRVDDVTLDHAGQGAKCHRCAAVILDERKPETRIGHVLSCLLMGHQYALSGERDGHHEYACHHCGHPLLFRAGADPYADQSGFKKRVRYLCGLFGHRVHRVTERHSHTEYACHCGHSFLRDEREAALVRHPPVCFFLGHYVRRIEHRAGCAEYRCRNCGHTFLFREGA
ncbi:MAG TPA: hypothetical protein VFD58_19970 [Blastocatellia bacterium]|nr:hypothetical protein [Blastocatellia bacterium]